MALQTDNEAASNGLPFLSDPLPNVMPNVDDLFGEDVAVGLAIPPPATELRRRVDDLRRHGCFQCIAWSKSGTIASITRDGLFVELRYLRCDPDDGSWQLSEPTRCDLVSGSDQIPLVHLAWSSASIPELAIIDSVGRVALLTFSISLNRPYFFRKWDADPIDDLNAIVGCYWLALKPQGRPYNVIHGPANRDNNRYRYETSLVQGQGPFHPNPSKSALVCVTANGQAKFFFSQNNNRIEETSLDIERISTTDDLITHASICSDKNVLYVVLINASKQMRLVKLSIQWGQPPGGDKQPLGTLPLNPSLSDRRLASTSWHQPGPNDSPLDAAAGLLSLVEILPSILENDGQTWAPPLILIARSYLGSPESPYQEPQSLLDRWQVLTDQKQAVHPAFLSLGGQKPKPATELPTTTRLRRQEPIVFNKIIVGLQIITLGKVICITFADGTIEYRDRLTMAEIYTEPNPDRIMDLHQVGFSFTDPTPSLQTVLSPTSCSLVQVCLDGDVKWKPLVYAGGDIGNSNQDPHYLPVLAGLTLAAGSAIYQAASFDDVLAVARSFVEKKRFNFDFTSEIISMLKVAFDYSEETHHDKLVRNVHLQMCLSTMNHLGFHGQYRQRTFGSKFSALALNARNIVILVTIASNTPPNIREKISPLDEPEVVDALAGCASWSIDLLSWLADSLFNLCDDPNFTGLVKDPAKFAGISTYLQQKNDVALHLLLCSSTRGLLVALCRRLQHLETLGNGVVGFWQKNSQQPQADGKVPNAALHKAYQRMQQITSSSLVKVQEFEKLLNQLGAEIRATYATIQAAMVSKASGQQASGQPGQPISKQLDTAIKAVQLQCELGMLLGIGIHPMFRKALGQFFTAHLSAFRATVDPAGLFFKDYSLLEVVSDSPQSLRMKRDAGSYVDMFRKVSMLPADEAGGEGAGRVVAGVPVWSGQWRRCVRCASVMEDVVSQRPGFTYVLSQQRKCPCGGNWGLLPKGSLVG